DERPPPPPPPLLRAGSARCGAASRREGSERAGGGSRRDGSERAGGASRRDDGSERAGGADRRSSPPRGYTDEGSRRPRSFAELSLPRETGKLPSSGRDRRAGGA